MEKVEWLGGWLDLSEMAEIEVAVKRGQRESRNFRIVPYAEGIEEKIKELSRLGGHFGIFRINRETFVALQKIS